MGSCEKCDDRASGRLDCDLTSERGKRQGGRGAAGERERKRQKGDKRMGKGEGRGAGQA